MKKKNVAELKALIGSLPGASIDDVILQGFFAREDRMFHAMLGTVHLDIGEGRFVELRVRESDCTMNLSLVNVVSPGFDVDPDTDFCTSPMGSVVFLSPTGDHRIAQVETFIIGEDDATTRALGLLLESGEYLFFDPSFLSGIKIGGVEQRNFWLANSPQMESLHRIDSAAVR